MLKIVPLAITTPLRVFLNLLPVFITLILATSCNSTADRSPASSSSSSSSGANLPLYIDRTDTQLNIAQLSGRTMDAASADFDGDGDNDILLAMEFQKNILLINNGQAEFSLADASYIPNTTHDSEDIGVADFDGDGDLDAVIVSEDDQTNELYINNGEGKFSLKENALGVTGVSNAVVVSDLNGDGNIDILIGNNGQNFCLINNGNASFTNETSTRLPSINDATQDLELGDIDADGDLDLIVGNEDSNNLLINNGSGFFTLSQNQLPLRATPEETREADFGDIDNDGDIDLIFANIRFIETQAVLQNRLLINDGTGVFRDVTFDQLPQDEDLSFDADFVDLDDDGDLDIVTANGLREQTRFKVYENNGTGFYSLATTKFFPASASGLGFDIEAVDFDNDGKLELYLASRNSQDILLQAR